MVSSSKDAMRRADSFQQSQSNMKQQTIDELFDIKTLTDTIIKELYYYNDGSDLVVIGGKISKIKEELESIIKIDLDLG